MAVRAKFRYTGYTATLATVSRLDADGYEIKGDDGRPIYDQTELRSLIFNPVYKNDDPESENSKFWRASPSGEVKLGTVNPQAWSQFEMGKCYYLDFIPAE